MARGLAMWAIMLLAFAAQGQRQMEKLGRGVIAMRTGTASAYVGWRLLATDPDGVGFNLYRVPNGGATVKLRSQPLTNTTDYVDSGATLTQSNAWFVRPVTNGVELAANAPTRPIINPVTRLGDGNYRLNFSGTAN